MSDAAEALPVEPAPTDATPASTPDPAPVAAEKRFSNAEVEELISNRLAAERAKVRRKTTRSAPQEPPPSTPDTAPAELSRTDERKFDRAMGSLGLNDMQYDLIEGIFRSERPEDIGTWVKEKATALGWAKSDTPPGASTPDPTSAAPPVDSPESDNGAPSSQPSYEQTGNPNLLTAEDRDRIIREKGFREGHRYIADMAKKWMKNRKVLPPQKK